MLDVSRDGSGYALDLAPVLDGLGPQVLVPAAAKTLEATRDDLHLEWTTGKHNRATLVVRFASGCAGKLGLAREATGAPACDELAALEAIATRCDSVSPPAISDEDRAVIAGAVHAGKKRIAAARVCKQHVAPMRASLVDAGCVPEPVLPMRRGAPIPECDALVATLVHIQRCNNIPAEAKQDLQTRVSNLAGWVNAPLPEGDSVEEHTRRMRTHCEITRTRLTEMLRFYGC